MNLFLNTNVILYFLGGDKKIIKLISSANCLVTSFISEIELFSYDVNEQEAQSIKEFLDKIEILYPDKETVKKTVEIRKNTHLKIPDAIIAAQAQQINFILATADKEILDKVEDIPTIDPYEN